MHFKSHITRLQQDFHFRILKLFPYLKGHQTEDAATMVNGHLFLNLKGHQTEDVATMVMGHLFLNLKGHQTEDVATMDMGYLFLTLLPETKSLCAHLF